MAALLSVLPAVTDSPNSVTAKTLTTLLDTLESETHISLVLLIIFVSQHRHTIFFLLHGVVLKPTQPYTQWILEVFVRE